MDIKKSIFLLTIGLLSLTACGDGYVKYSCVYVDGNPYYSEENPYIYTARYEIEERLAHHVSYELNGKQYMFFYYQNYSSEDFTFPEKCYFVDAADKGKTVFAKLSSKTNKYVNYQYIYYSQSKRSLKVEEGRHKAVKAPNNKDMQEKIMYSITTIASDRVEYHFSSYVDPKTGFTLDPKTTVTFIDLGNGTVAYQE